MSNNNLSLKHFISTSNLVNIGNNYYMISNRIDTGVYKSGYKFVGPLTDDFIMKLFDDATILSGIPVAIFTAALGPAFNKALFAKAVNIFIKNCVLKSTDNGTSWNLFYSTPNPIDTMVSSPDRSRLCFVSGETFYISYDETNVLIYKAPVLNKTVL
jgi:hypothetical protein